MPVPNYYKILQIDPEAEPDVVKVVYRRLSLKYHPDGTAPDETRMRQLNEAYEVIGDEARRKRYDANLLYEKPLSDNSWRPTRSPTYWDPPKNPFTASPAAPRRRSRNGLGSRATMMVGSIVIVLFAAAMVLPGLAGLTAARLPPTPDAIMQSTPTVFPVSRQVVLDTLASQGFTLSTAYSDSGQMINITNDVNATITIFGSSDGVERIKLEAIREPAVSPEVRDNQTRLIEALLTVVKISASARDQIVLWTADWDRLTSASATFRVDLARIEIITDPALDRLEMDLRPDGATGN